MIKAGIIGSTGYAGAELVRILLRHKDVEIKWYGSRSYVDEKYASVYRNMFELVEDKCLDDNIEELADQVDVIFTATPQGYLGGILNEELLKKGGLMCVTIYHGGATGFEERDTLLELLREIDSDRFQVISTFFHNWKKEPPIPIFIYKYTDSERD